MWAAEARRGPCGAAAESEVGRGSKLSGPPPSDSGDLCARVAGPGPALPASPPLLRGRGPGQVGPGGARACGEAPTKAAPERAQVVASGRERV